MMEMQIPERLKGRWEHLLILTYGADIPFFENALWNLLSETCRNKIILADGDRFLDSCAYYALDARMVRHLNQRYVAEGIFSPRAAHAKAILLTSATGGRLLVGSGNLSWQGYASGGELFTEYEFAPHRPTSRNAFVAVRQLVDGLLNRGYVADSARRRIEYMWEKTPWLFQPTESRPSPVRPNLEDSFLTQLQEVVADEPVEELVVRAPFHDPECVALRRLLSTLVPQEVTLLVCPGQTTARAPALERMLAEHSTSLQIRPVAKGEDAPYVHAKLCLCKMQSRAACLQGSPNLSQVALLLSPPQGKIELANLLPEDR